MSRPRIGQDRSADGCVPCHCVGVYEPQVGAAKITLDLGPANLPLPEEARPSPALQPALHARAKVLPKISTDRGATSLSRLLPSAGAFPLLHSILLMTSRSLPLFAQFR